jgi:beta-galactosidase
MAPPSPTPSLTSPATVTCNLGPTVASNIAPPLTDTSAPEITLVAAPPNGSVTISVSTRLNTSTNIRLEWQILLNGLPGPKGVFPLLPLHPHHPSVLHLPVKLAPGNEEAWLRVTCRPAAHPLPKGKRVAPAPAAGFERLLPLHPWRGDLAIPPAGELTFTDSNGLFTISAPNMLIQFDKQTGWLLHYEAGQILLMGDTAGVQPALWPTIPPRLQLFSTSTGTQLVIVRAEYTLPETASLLHLSYTINAAGAMLIGQILEADTNQHVPDSVKLPPLPAFGMHWLLPAGLDTLSWFGSADSTGPTPTGPERTDPTAPTLLHRSLAPVMGSREIIPAVRWLTITGHEGTGLRITADSALLELHTSTASDQIRTQLDIDAPLLASPSTRAGQYNFKITPVLPPAPAPIHPSAPSIHRQNR